MKKVLAWAVALALVLSSFTMAFADQAKTSKDFKDASQIQYTEAVDVMVATGIINGYPDGTFGPLKTVKRSEMAKMIACIMNGGEDVGDQYKGACPFADSKDHWAAGYIAYCASEHIIDGRSADVFDPEAEVTGTEVAKMALTSLGYDSGIQGYTGENWAANVLKDAKKAKLFDGLDSSFVPGDPCSREAAAQILFNMLKAPMVEYDTNTSVTVGDATVSVNSKVNKVVADDERDKEGNVKEDETGFVELYEEVFDGKLDQNETDVDGFGNPSHSWTYDGDDVGNYVDSTDYEFTAEDEGFAAALKAFDEDMAEDLKAGDAEDLEAGDIVIKTMTMNGMKIDEEDMAEDYDEILADEYLVGLGDTVKMYDVTSSDDEATVYDVVIEKYIAVQITEVDTDLTKDEAKKNTARITVQFEGEEGTPILDSKFGGYDAETYVEDAVIAVAIDYTSSGREPEIIDSYVMDELVSGEVTKTFGRDSMDAVTIDGTKYELATYYNPVDGKVLAIESEYTLYDYNGYALASVQTAEPESDVFYGVLTEVGYSTATFASDNAYVYKMINAEGEEVVFNLDEDFENNYQQQTYDILSAYSLNDDGAIKAMNDMEGFTFDAVISGAEMKTGGVLTTDKGNKIVSEDVVVFYYDKDDEAWTVYGYSDLESAESISGVCILNGDEEIAAIELTAPLEAEETTLGFITDYETYSTSDGPMADVTVMIDGKESTYTTVAKYNFTLTKDDTLYEFTINNDGELAGVEEVDPSYSAQLVEKFEECDAVYTYGQLLSKKGSNMLEVSEANNFQLVSDAVFYYVNADGVVEPTTFSKIKAKTDSIPMREVTLYQTDEDAAAWNIVLYYDENSFSSLL